MRKIIMVITLLGFVLVDVILVYLTFVVSPVKLKRESFTFQYGEEIPTDVSYYVNANENVLESVKMDFSHVSKEVGKYKARVIYFDKVYDFDIVVEDTTKPKVHLKKVEWEVEIGDQLSAINMIDVDDFSDTYAYFYNEETGEKVESKYYLVEGAYVERIIVEDTYGNQSAVLRVKVVVESNKVPPVIEGVDDVVLNLNESFNLYEGVTAYDDQDGDLTKQIIIEGRFDNAIVGEYEITYRVKDSAGNETKCVRKVKVVGEEDNR